MMPDSDREGLVDQVRLWFGIQNHGLEQSALDLQDAGWTWDSMRPLLARVFNAGFDEGGRMNAD